MKLTDDLAKKLDPDLQEVKTKVSKFGNENKKSQKEINRLKNKLIRLEAVISE